MRSSGFEFKIFDLPYAAWKIDEWEIEVKLAVKRLVWNLNEFLSSKSIAPTREHCVTKYGRCQFFDVCDSMPRMRDQLIFNKDLYEVSSWSPLT